MSSEVIYYREYSVNEPGLENILVKSGRSVSQKTAGTSRTRRLLSFHTLLSLLKEIFLPEGYPDSVHPDYTAYQIWDTIQAFSSTILGTLTTHSILTGVGVGESTATPLAATIAWILKDGAGMIGRIVFAWWNGSQLDAQCKKWRIFADVLNDIAMGIELLLPHFASSYTTVVLCLSTTMKSIVGVAGGATRAALTQHQALQNNLADVSAKDGSQETFVNLIASFAGIFVLSYIPSSFVMELYIFLVIIHVYANYSAVRALRLNSFNEDRLAIVINEYLLKGTIINVEEANRLESLFLLQKPFKNACGFDIKIGASLSKILKQSNVHDTNYLSKLKNHFRRRKYIIVPDMKRKTIYVGLVDSIQSSDILQAYFYAHFWAMAISLQMNLRQDIMDNMMKSHENSPLAKLYDVIKTFEEPEDSDLNSTIFQSIVRNDIRILGDFRCFTEFLDKSDWQGETNLLPIGEWRAYWED